MIGLFEIMMKNFNEKFCQMTLEGSCVCVCFCIHYTAINLCYISTPNILYSKFHSNADDEKERKRDLESLLTNWKADFKVCILDPMISVQYCTNNKTMYFPYFLYPLRFLFFYSKYFFVAQQLFIFNYINWNNRYIVRKWKKIRFYVKKEILIPSTRF